MSKIWMAKINLERVSNFTSLISYIAKTKFSLGLMKLRTLNLNLLTGFCISNFHTKFTQLYSVEKNYSVLAEKVFVFFRCSKIRLSKFFCCLSSSKSSLESKIRPICFWLVANWTSALLISKLNISFSCTYLRNWLLWFVYLCQS